MLRYTLRQMRASLRHLLAAATAIVVSTGFVAAALVGSGAMNDVLRNLMTLRMADADLLVRPPDITPAPPGVEQSIKAVYGVEDTYLILESWGDLAANGSVESVTVQAAANSPQLTAWPVTEGAEPTKAGEVSLAAGVARRLGLTVGDTAELSFGFNHLQADSVSIGSSDEGAVAGDQGAEGEGSGAQPADSAPPDGRGTGLAGGEGQPPVTEEDPSSQTIEWEVVEAPVTVVGLIDDSAPTFWTRPGVVTPVSTLKRIGLLNPTSDNPLGAISTESVLVAAEPGADLKPGSAFRQAVGEALQQAMGGEPALEACEDSLRTDSTGSAPDYHEFDSGCVVRVFDRAQAGDQAIRDYIGSTVFITAVALIFGLVGLMVAAMVIANTFQVMIAGRTRTLALLRSVGATRSQVRGSVVTEALLMGLLGALVGVLIGWGLIQGAALIAAKVYPSIPIPTSIRLPWLAVVAGAVVGTGTTVLASLIPARLASRVAPVAALRPQDPPTLAAPAGKRRLSLAIIFAAVGAVMVAGGLTMALQDNGSNAVDETAALAGAAVGVLGAGALAVGIIVGAVFWLPKVVALITRAMSHFGGPARIAAANSARNPRRTAATATALMIGVTLVAAMVTGAACVSAGMDKAINTFTPLDVSVSAGVYKGGPRNPDEVERDRNADAYGATINSIPTSLVERISTLDVVAGAATVTIGDIAIRDADGNEWIYPAYGIDPAAGSQAVNEPSMFDDLNRDSVLVSDYLAGTIYSGGSLDGDSSGEAILGRTWEVAGLNGASRELKFNPTPDALWFVEGSVVVMDAATLRELDPRAATVALWLRLEPDAEPVDAVTEIQELVTRDSNVEEGQSYSVGGEAVMRSENHKVVDTMLLIGLALLAVSVLVALVGVSNTLSLSVIERARETALLRALGLTRGGVRMMLALEGMVIAGVAGLMGVLIGWGYGSLGAALLLGPTDYAAMAVPVERLLLILILSVLVGLLAAILPGRRAAKTAPAEALASE